MHAHLRFLAAPAAAIALAACGASNASPSATPRHASSPSSVASNTSASPEVTVENRAKFGMILVDAHGMTLYTLTNAGMQVPCSGACAQAWPPLLLPMGTTRATGGPGVESLGTVPATGGAQVTANGALLFRFTGDNAAGDVRGDGINTFGGVWHVVSAGPRAGTGADSVPTTTQGSQSYGY
jgi:predicted lipoprotein with Yx(FWY)xxD motif